MNRKTMLSMLACALGAAAFAPAHAQEAFPSRPITLVIPFPAGGATDVLGRLIGKKLGDKLGQSVVIDNRAGAGTVIGMLLPRDETGARKLPASVSYALQAATLGPRLTDAGLSPQASLRSGALAPEDLNRLAEGMTVLVSCW